jgi:hypothetical protein
VPLMSLSPLRPAAARPVGPALQGSYHNLDGGSTLWALECFTGDYVFKFKLDDQVGVPAMRTHARTGSPLAALSPHTHIPEHRGFPRVTASSGCSLRAHA